MGLPLRSSTRVMPASSRVAIIVGPFPLINATASDRDALATYDDNCFAKHRRHIGISNSDLGRGIHAALTRQKLHV